MASSPETHHLGFCLSALLGLVWTGRGVIPRVLGLLTFGRPRGSKLKTLARCFKLDATLLSSLVCRTRRTLHSPLFPGARPGSIWLCSIDSVLVAHQPLRLSQLPQSNLSLSLRVRRSFRSSLSCGVCFKPSCFLPSTSSPPDVPTALTARDRLECVEEERPRGNDQQTMHSL